MEKIRKYWFLLLLGQAFAQLTCDDLSGVWWGSMQDKTHLMLDEPIPVLLHIEKKQGRYIGQFELLQDVPSISSRIWVAQCEQGIIKNVYFLDPKNNFCGIASPNVELKDGMRMALNWQSAMMDAELAVNLMPLQNKAEIKQGMLSISSPQTCH